MTPFFSVSKLTFPIKNTFTSQWRKKMLFFLPMDHELGLLIIRARITLKQSYWFQRLSWKVVQASYTPGWPANVHEYDRLKDRIKSRVSWEILRVASFHVASRFMNYNLLPARWQWNMETGILARNLVLCRQDVNLDSCSWPSERVYCSNL